MTVKHIETAPYQETLEEVFLFKMNYNNDETDQYSSASLELLKDGGGVWRMNEIEMLTVSRAEMKDLYTFLGDHLMATSK